MQQIFNSDLKLEITFKQTKNALDILLLKLEVEV